MTVVLSVEQPLYQVAALDIAYLVCLEAQNLTETPGYIQMLIQRPWLTWFDIKYLFPVLNQQRQKIWTAEAWLLSLEKKWNSTSYMYILL